MDDTTLPTAPNGKGRILLIACGALAREILALNEGKRLGPPSPALFACKLSPHARQNSERR